MKEADLYQPTKELLENLDFTVKGEVKTCDIAAIRNDELWIIELKRHMSIDLVYQAMERQTISPFVFVGIPRPKVGDRRAFKLLKKLDIGLITVALDSPVVRAEIASFPIGSGRYGKRAEIIRKEVRGRIGDTPGGSTGIPITTAYKERCIKIACLLGQVNDLSAKELKQYGCENDTSSILRRNQYNWYEKIKRGRYALSEVGQNFLDDNKHSQVITYYIDYAKNCLI